MPARQLVFLIPSLIVGGAQRQLIELASGLDRSGWHVVVFVFRGGGALEADLASRGVRVVSLEKGGKWDILPFTYRLIRELRRARPAVVHSYLGPANVMAALTRFASPRTRIVWGVRASAMDFRHYDRLAGLLFRVECRLSRYADLIICNSAAGLDAHVTCGYPSKRTVVVANGIDSNRFAPDAAARRALRSEWRVPESDMVIGCIGRTDPKKDHATFLRAASLLRDLEGVRFVCVGNDPRKRRPELERLATSLGLDGRLVWVDARPDVAKVYNALDLLVSSSSWGEGFPNVVGEAMATGVPCVVTDVGDSALVVGDVGWVCRPGDPANLADAVRMALSSGEVLADYGRRARERVNSEFSLTRLIESTSDHLSRVLDQGPAV